MTQTLPLSEVKIKLSALVEDVLRREDEIVITRNGKPVAVILSADEYDSWKETQEIKRDPKLMDEIKKGLKAIQKGKAKTFTSLNQLFGSSLE